MRQSRFRSVGWYRHRRTNLFAIRNVEDDDDELLISGAMATTSFHIEERKSKKDVEIYFSVTNSLHIFDNERESQRQSLALSLSMMFRIVCLCICMRLFV